MTNPALIFPTICGVAGIAVAVWAVWREARRKPPTTEYVGVLTYWCPGHWKQRGYQCDTFSTCLDRGCQRGYSA